MKKTLLTISIMAGLMMTACVKESANEQMGLPEGAMMLTTEGFQGHNTKTSVSGTSVQWVGDGTEKVYLNGNEYTVGLNGDKAYVTAGDGDKTSTTYGYYGVSGVSASDVANFTVTVPASYTSSYSGGRQVIALPMVAYNATGDKIEFKHVTAAVKVRVKNNTGYDVYLDSVVVSSDAYQLSGTTSAFDVTAANLSIAANKTEVAAVDKRVKVAFANKAVTIANGGSDIKEVQVPILPVGSDANLTIKVYTHKLVARTGMPSVNYDYNFVHTSTVPAALVRNVMITAQVEIKEQTNDVDNHITEVDHSIFTTRTGNVGSYVYTQVRFSKGNLQYVPNNSTWSFHTNQYDICESTSQGWATSDNTSRYGSAEGTNAIDMFGWGTSGQSHGATSYMPYCNSTTNSEYYAYGVNSNDLNSSTGTADWGYNDITGEGAGKWRTLPKDDIYSLFNQTPNRTTTSRLTGTNSSNAAYTKATVCGVKGVILFPDKYVHPDGLVSESGTHYFNNTSSSTYTSFVLTDSDDWKLMEEAGAIFLPSGGYRNGNKIMYGGSYSSPYGCYWTSTHYDNNNAIPLYFDNSSLNTNKTNYGKCYGCFVRLVKDVE